MELVAEPNYGWHRRNRNKSSWNNVVADQCIKEGGFASFELTDTSYIETSFRNPCCELARFLGDRISPKCLSQVGKSQQTGGAIQT